MSAQVVDVVAAATAGFEAARVMRAQADAEAAKLKDQDVSLVDQMDKIQQDYTRLAEELGSVRSKLTQQQQVGDAMSDAMDSYDSVLRVNGIERDSGD